MAPKDYVSRGRSTKKAPPPPTSPSLPWGRIIVTLILVVGFVGFLWTIKDKAPESTQDASTKQKESLAKEEELPVMTEEEWQFIKTLPEYSVEIEKQEQKSRERPYLMQCGSFRREAQAQEMKAKIAFLGLVAQVKPSDGKSGRWHRVILGPYTSKRQAEKDRHAIRLNGGIRTCKIWDW